MIQYFHELMTETVWGISVRDILVVSMCLLCACVADIIFVRKLPVWLDKISEQVRLRRRRMQRIREHEEAIHGPDGIEQKPVNSEDADKRAEEHEDEIKPDVTVDSTVAEDEKSAKEMSGSGDADASESVKKVADEGGAKSSQTAEKSEDEKTEKEFADHFERSLSMFEIVVTSLRKPLRFVIYLAFFGLSLKLLSKVPGEETPFRDVLTNIVQSGLVVCLVWYAIIVTNRLTHQFSLWAQKTESKLDDMLVPLISSVVKFLVIFIGVLLVMQSMGYQVSSLIAGLGIGGAALALASKDTLANLFGAFVVFFDKPFEIGDWISVNGVEGEVEEIRLRTTVIRTWDNSVVTLPNQVLSTDNINNYERRHYRKMECGFGVLYSTKSDQIEEIVKKIKAHLAVNAVKDPANIKPEEIYAPNYYVAFKGFGDSSLDIQVTVFTVNRGLARHIEDRQRFLLEIMHIVEEAGTGFAFPTRTLEWAPGMMPMLPPGSGKG